MCSSDLAATCNYSTPKDATQGGTMLTGAAGAPVDPITLGRTTLLGQ